MSNTEEVNEEEEVNSKKIKEIQKLRDTSIVPMKVRPNINAEFAKYLEGKTVSKKVY